MRNKPLPTLADQLLFKKDSDFIVTHRKFREIFKSHLLRAEKFVFDYDATIRIMQLCMEAPEVIAQYSQFIKLPYHNTWVEIDARAISDFLGTTDFSSDSRLGFLYNEDTILSAVSSRDANVDEMAALIQRAEDEGVPPNKEAFVEWAKANEDENRLFISDAQISPWKFTRNLPLSEDIAADLCLSIGIPPERLNSLFWGLSLEKLDPQWHHSLLQQNSIELLYDTSQAPPEAKAQLFSSISGDIRIALAVAMFLLRPNLTKVVNEVGRRKSFRISGPRNYVAHNIVTIKLDTEKAIRRVIKAAKEECDRKRFHSVRGHWAHNQEAKRGCFLHNWHEWKPGSEYCLNGCGGKRWWKEEHHRGDPSVGVVMKHYVIQPN